MRIQLAAGLVLALALGSAATGAAQAPDFSGTWNLDRDASEFPQPGGFGGGRGGGGRGRGGPPGGGFRAGVPDSLVITQSADVLTVDQWSDRGALTLEYRLDGQASTNPGPRGDVTTTSRWDGAQLVTEGSQQVSILLREVEIGIVERRSLSADGRTLTIASTRSTPRGDIAFTLVYRKE